MVLILTSSYVARTRVQVSDTGMCPTRVLLNFCKFFHIFEGLERHTHVRICVGHGYFRENEESVQHRCRVGILRREMMPSNHIDVSQIFALLFLVKRGHADTLIFLVLTLNSFSFVVIFSSFIPLLNYLLD